MMRKLIWFTAGMITLAIVFSASVILFLTTQVAGFSTREQPSAMERWAAQRFRALAVLKNAKSRSNPLADSAEILASARAHWADHCASCHSNNGSGHVEMGKHLYPPAPDVRQLATMPAWGIVAKASDTGVSVKMKEAKIVEVQFGEKTTFLRAKVAIDKVSIKVGDRIVIHTPKVNDKLVAHTVEIGTAAAPAQKELK